MEVGSGSSAVGLGTMILLSNEKSYQISGPSKVTSCIKSKQVEPIDLDL